MLKIHPMLATLIPKPFDSKEWLFEIKWDGYRALAYKNAEVTLLSRNHKVLNKRFPHIAQAIKKMPGSFLFDGEIVALDKTGRSHFQLLQNAHPHCTYIIFDILFLNGSDLRSLPLLERKRILKKVLPKRNSLLQYGDFILQKGTALFKAAQKKGLEGIIAKKCTSTYQQHRSREWLKIKAGSREEAVIAGFTKPRGSRQHFGSLVLGIHRGKELQYIGCVGTGFTESSLAQIYAILKKITRSRCPFTTAPMIKNLASWVKPQLLCEVTFAEWTQDGLLRQPVFKGLKT